MESINYLWKIINFLWKIINFLCKIIWEEQEDRDREESRDRGEENKKDREKENKKRGGFSRLTVAWELLEKKHN